ncbi:MAG: maltose alpha-D-glucosyltransferase [Oscillatoriales cyanobacterium C42_A2020_001]|nr:maltose alpha-D-glucosyltransferase [Leptolyngbyaceae cyanobacterium C42_A2020_001]
MCCVDWKTVQDDSLWFKNAIIYEVPVRAFADSNGDGIGDFRGLTEKLDYLQELGITAIWLLPFFPSPLRDDGYDIADYTNVNPIYGTLDDFKELLEAAHQRDIRVIIELIVNHTSDQHPWFQRSRRAPQGSSERDFYVWSDTTEKYQEARIIFQDFETSNWTWDPVAKAYFWHRFYSHQPDLNYDNPAVQKAVFDVLDFWLKLGVDGLRMDAVPYLYERDGTNCENLPETHDFLKQLRRHVDQHFPNRMLLAEANQWPEDAAAYYGNGDECHMNFHFPLMPRLFMALRMEDTFPITDILQQTPPIPDNCQWGLFLRNHDELTLEMVTDEDRDYMYRVYAQDPEMRVNLGIRRRLAPLLGNDRRQIELLNSLLLALPGTPVLYYGDEIGMGDNVYVGDRNGVRTPMQWSGDRNAGFSRANPHRLYLPLIADSEYHYTTVNVETQRSNPNSLLNSMKRLIVTRKRFEALGKGDFQLLHPENRKVIAFTRTYGEEQILVVANLSRFVQTVELDLTTFQGRVPVEIFGRSQFPAITQLPYFLSLGAYSFYWFTLKPQEVSLPIKPQIIPTLAINRPGFTVKTASVRELFNHSDFKAKLESCLPNYLMQYRWFNGKTRTIQATEITEAIAIPYQDREACLTWLRVDYIQGASQTFLLFLGILVGESAARLATDIPQAIIARLSGLESEDAVLFDEVACTDSAYPDKAFCSALLGAISENCCYSGIEGELSCIATDLFAAISGNVPVESMPLKGEHSNTSIIFYDSANSREAAHLILKLFRKVESGINPDLEIRRFLDERQQFKNITSIAGWLEYRRPHAEGMTLGILQEYISDARNTWDYTLDSLRDYLEYVAVQQTELTEVPVPKESLLELQATEIPSLAREAIGSYLANMNLLGQRTAELHVALAADFSHPAFAPEVFTSFYQRSLYQYARNLVGHVFLQLKQQLKELPVAIQPLAETALAHQVVCLERFRLVLDQKITAKRTRYHGDYHLGQVLYTGKDFFIIDFEGETDRTVSERRMKRSPLRDVASMLQSFHYAANFALQSEVESGIIHAEQIPRMQQWVEFWEQWVSATFLNAYLATAQKDSFLPTTQQELQVLLNNYLLERAIDDLGYELNHPSERVRIPLSRILQLIL